jgi:orotate phosphoribosyltransferase
VRGKRVAIVNDVINAGSAVRGAFTGLVDCGAQPVAIGTLLTLGSWAAEFAAVENLALETLASLPNTVWEPSDCPLCKKGIQLSD